MNFKITALPWMIGGAIGCYVVGDWTWFTCTGITMGFLVITKQVDIL